MLDGDQWGGWSKARQLAVLDHELTHLVLKEADGAPKLDDIGRPKLGMRLHDYQHGWFAEAAERHGDASVEREQARKVLDDHGQVLMPWLYEDVAGGAARKPISRGLKEAIRNLAPKRGSGIDAVTVSALGQSVTLTPEIRERLTNELSVTTGAGE